MILFKEHRFLYRTVQRTSAYRRLCPRIVAEYRYRAFADAVFSVRRILRRLPIFFPTIRAEALVNTRILCSRFVFPIETVAGDGRFRFRDFFFVRRVV